MFRRQYFLKTVACGLLINILSYTLFPTISYALTSGPTAPEATSFEPVDTTDMINLMTGDVAYSLPILDVPGPEGNYPLALSYHSGIFPDEDASWVGLGWSLNPGAITRKVNGYADDHSSAKTSTLNYVDLGVGKAVIADVAGEANAMGLIYSANNGQGFGGVNYNSPAYMAVGLNSAGAYTSADIHAKVSDDINAQKSLADIAANLGGNNHPSPVIDDWINEQLNNIKPSHSVKAIIPLPKDPSINVYVENNFYRYYKSYTTNNNVTGPLKYSTGSNTNGTTSSLDCYPSIDQSYNTEVYKTGGSFPAYDNYTVTAQGLSGSIRPYIFENGSLFRQDVVPSPANAGNAGDTRFYNINPFAKSKVNFRFEGDFSNSLLMNPDPVSIVNNVLATSGNTHAAVNAAGYNATTQQLAGSKHIEWFTNEEVSNGAAKSKGFIGYKDIDSQAIHVYSTITGTCNNRKQKFDRTQITGHIAGYMITNESGMTYHYALPVYTYNHFSLARTIGDQLNRIEQSDSNAYAYEWLLTAVTGADYVDVDNNGLVNDFDTGHWVSFGYGKWTDKFVWRSPDVGYNTDIDANSETFTGGKKELYYLDFIRTRTHTALFIKEIRKDAKGVADHKAGGYMMTNLYDPGTVNMTSIPASTLRLKEIQLHKNSTLAGLYAGNSIADNYALKSLGTLYTDFGLGNSGESCEFINIHMGKNVLDINDLSTNLYASLKSISLKTVSFTHDYSLCDGTPNSFDTNVNDYYGTFYNQYWNAAPEFPKTGKLTLNSIKMYGKGGADMIPGTNFSYALPSPNSHSVSISNIPGSLPEGAHLGRVNFGGPTHFVNGDIISFTINSKIFYASLVNTIPSTYTTNVVFFGNNIPVSADLNISATAYETKNPGYKKGFIDKWGFLKSDYDPSVGSVNGGKKVTAVSQRGVDAWCLRSIETPIGAKINISYESDQYETPELYNNSYDFNVSGLHLQDATNKTFSLSFFNSPDLINSFVVGSRLDFFGQMFTKYHLNGAPGVSNFKVESMATVIQVGSNFLMVKFDDPNFIPLINSSQVYDQNGNMIVVDYFTNYFVTGSMRYVENQTYYGGGVRVKNLSVTGTGFNLETNYVYDENPGYTSGVTSYEPVYADQSSFIFPPWQSYNDIDNTSYTNAINALKESWRNNFLAQILVNIKELPGPGVIYGCVSVKERSNGVDAPKYNKYHFETFSVDMLTNNTVYDVYGSDMYNGQVRNWKNQMMNIKKYTSKVGSLRSIVTYDNNNRALTKILNTYLSDQLTSDGSLTGSQTALQANIGNLGQISEVFTDYRVINQSMQMAATAVRTEYPNVPMGVEVYDFLKGTSAKTYTTAYDYYNGQATKTLATNSYGDTIVTEKIPAYIKYPEMGLKVNNIANRHMLAQTTGKYVYKSNSVGNKVMLAADITTWSKNWNYRTYFPGYYTAAVSDYAGTVQNEQVYRPYKTYQWNAPMLYSDGSFQSYVDFDWTKEANGTAQSKYWQATSETTLFDAFSHPLEVKDINGNYASSKMGGYLEGQILANATNARFTEMTHTSMEDVPLNNYNNYYFAGEVYGNSAKDATHAHTGSYCIKIPAGSSYFALYSINNSEPTRIEFERGRNYRASIWVYKDNLASANLMYSVSNGSTVYASGSATASASLPNTGDWYKLSLDIAVPAVANNVLNLQVYLGNMSNTLPIYLDDFRFQPIESKMCSYLYDQQTGQLTHILDNENMYVRYEYDPMGRLSAVYKETLKGEKKLKDYYYNYARK